MTPISPELALAMNVAANRGVYALLLGSGVSRSAGIPTGWDMVLDLVRRLAAVMGVNPEPDPESWYSSEFGEPPRYSALLEQVAPKQAERQSLLKGYFEPASEGEGGSKAPTAAHRAIAELVAGGWVRIVVTTNFDRLMESALEDAGIAPVVIATADHVEGTPPLVHNRCTVIKVHGDYLDTRIKNSEEELAEYHPAMDALLGRVVDDYGLLICGWSGEYDVALRAALQRSKSKYTKYWCSRGNLAPAAEQLAADLSAVVIPIEAADSFFPKLHERVAGMNNSQEVSPMDTRVGIETPGIETLKAYLADKGHHIQLRELIREATEELVAHLNVEEFPTSPDFTDEAVAERIRQVDALSERPAGLLANGSYWGSTEHNDAWLDAIRRMAEVDPLSGKRTKWADVFRYPALLCIYAVGVAAVAKGRYDLLASLLQTSSRSPQGREPEPIVQALYPESIVPTSAAHLLYPHPDAPQQRYFVPRNQFLHLTLRPIFAKLIPADLDYTEAFDLFEYMASLVERDLDIHSANGFPMHRWFDLRARGFTWRRSGMAERMEKEIDEAGERWPPLQAGLFGGSVERLLEAKGAVDKDNSEYLS